MNQRSVEPRACALKQASSFFIFIELVTAPWCNGCERKTAASGKRGAGSMRVSDVAEVMCSSVRTSVAAVARPHLRLVEQAFGVHR